MSPRVKKRREAMVSRPGFRDGFGDEASDGFGLGEED